MPSQHRHHSATGKPAPRRIFHKSFTDPLHLLPFNIMINYKILAYLIIIIGAAQCLLKAESDYYPPSETSVTLEHIEKMYIPKMVFKHASIIEVCKFLSNQSIALDPSKKGMVVTTEPSNDERFKSIFITLDLENVLFSGALEILTQIAPVKYGIFDSVIVFRINDKLIDAAKQQ
jgi:hypothetical protein